MTIAPFDQRELAAWIDEEIGPIGDYILQPGETTAPAYYALCRTQDPTVTKRKCIWRLDKLVELGKMTKHMEKIAGRGTWVYAKVEERDE